MRHFILVTNESRDIDMAMTRRVRDFLEKKGCTCWCANDELDLEGLHFETEKLMKRMPEDAECILVLGGDGTLLRAARSLVGRGLPFLGINIGNLGYLTEGDRSNAEEILEKVIADEYIIEERMMLEGQVTGADGITRAGGTALNDLTLNRSGNLRVIRFRLYVNGEFLYHYTADGIIVSTPTGSTAYSLSCGGPVVEPTARLFVVTPISPHSLNNRSLILSSEDELEIELLGAGAADPPVSSGEEETNCICYFDGESEVRLKAGDRIRIGRSESITRIMKLSRQSFVETLRIRMS